MKDLLIWFPPHNHTHIWYSKSVRCNLNPLLGKNMNTPPAYRGTK